MNVLLAGIVGSTAYGLATPESDIDRLGVYAELTSRFHGLHLPIDGAASKVTTEPDVTMHEARKFAQLCLSCNPTVTELLWLPDDLYEVRTVHGDQLIAIRTAFASAKRVRDAYFGYATAQFRRLLDTGTFASKVRSRQAKHARHLLRLLTQGYGFYASGQLTIRVTDPQRYIDFGEKVAQDPERARASLASFAALFNSVKSPLPDKPDERTVEQWLHDVRLFH